MKAIRVHAFGGPEQLVLDEIDDPRPGPSDVLIEIRAAGVNPVDTHPLRTLFTPMSSVNTYERLLAFLDQHNVSYRLIDHPPEGRTELVSTMRGHDVRHAAKCMVLIIKQGKKVTRYVLAVVPGNARVDLQAVKSLMQATYVSFASPEIAEELSGAPTGAVLPFSFHPSLELIVEPSLLESDDIYFNAARLDRSLALSSREYIAVAKPRLAAIGLTA